MWSPVASDRHPPGLPTRERLLRLAATETARPGDTIDVAAGTYSENLAITKNRITLRGAGFGSIGTLLLLPDEPTPDVCSIEVEGVLLVDGICVAGEFNPETFELGDPVVGPEITGFVVDAARRPLRRYAKRVASAGSWPRPPAAANKAERASGEQARKAPNGYGSSVKRASAGSPWEPRPR